MKVTSARQGREIDARVSCAHNKLKKKRKRKMNEQRCGMLTGGEGLGQIALKLCSLLLVVDNKCVPEEAASVSMKNRAGDQGRKSNEWSVWSRVVWL